MRADYATFSVTDQDPRIAAQDPGVARILDLAAIAMRMPGQPVFAATLDASPVRDSEAFAVVVDEISTIRLAGEISSAELDHG